MTLPGSWRSPQGASTSLNESGIRARRQDRDCRSFDVPHGSAVPFDCAQDYQARARLPDGLFARVPLSRSGLTEAPTFELIGSRVPQNLRNFDVADLIAQPL